MTSKQTGRLIGVVVTVGVIYIAYKYITRPSNKATQTNTNTGAVLPTPITSGGASNTAITNKPNVVLRHNPATKNYWLWTNNQDQVIPAAGTLVGKVLGIYPDDLGDKSQKWYKLDTKSTEFLHNGDNLYVNTNDVTVS